MTFCEGAGPPAVDGRAICAACVYGERLPVDAAATWLESFDVVDRLDSLRSEACDSEDCDLWPDGECGLGGGRSGNLSSIVCNWRGDFSGQVRGQAEIRITVALSRLSRDYVIVVLPLRMLDMLATRTQGCIGLLARAGGRRHTRNRKAETSPQSGSLDGTSHVIQK